MKTKTVLYVDMWKGEWIQELKLSGINRYANKLAWRIIPISEEMSRPKPLALYIFGKSERNIDCVLRETTAGSTKGKGRPQDNWIANLLSSLKSFFITGTLSQISNHDSTI